MKTGIQGLVVVLLGALSGTASAQAAASLDESCRVEMPGITFTRSLNGAASQYKLQGRKLVLSSPPKRDFFRYPGFDANSAPVLLAEVDNGKPFTLTARMSPSFLQTYDAGAFYIYVRDDLWLKLAMEMDERHKTRMVTVRTTGTSDDNDHEVIAASAVHLKISSDARTVGLYYSLDGKTWQMLRMFRNEYPASIWVGVSSQSPEGHGNSTTFEGLSLTDKAVADFRLGV